MSTARRSSARRLPPAFRRSSSPTRFRRHFSALWDRMGITYDDYIRTTEPRHKRGVQKLFRDSESTAAPSISSTYTGQYCVSARDVRRRPARHASARTAAHRDRHRRELLLQALRVPAPTLIEPDRIRAIPLLIQPEAVRQRGAQLLRGGLKDLSISRTSFKWGIPVPGNEKHVVYVWLDALANYMTPSATARDDPADMATFEKYWPADLHLVGKEIIRFHCVYWPAFLLAAGLPLPKAITAHGWLLFEESKMSKSRGNIVRTETILDAFGELYQAQAYRRAPGAVLSDEYWKHEQRSLRLRCSALLPAARDSLWAGRKLQLRCAGPALQQRPGQWLRQSRQPDVEHDCTSTLAEWCLSRVQRPVSDGRFARDFEDYR